MALGFGKALLRTTLPANFELTFSFFAPTTEGTQSIFSLESEGSGEILGLSTAVGPGEQLALYVFGNPCSGPVLRSDYETEWVTVVVEWVGGFVIVSSHGSVVSHEIASFTSTPPMSPLEAVLSFSGTQSVTAKGYVRGVHISGAQATLPIRFRINYNHF
jgi:hypothetical protein